MPSKRAKNVELLIRREKIVRGYAMGMTIYELAQMFEVDPSTISRDIKRCCQAKEDAILASLRQIHQEQLLKVDQAEREAWEAWQRSKQEKVVKVAETGPSGDKTTLRREECFGNPIYLALALKCVEQRQKMLESYPRPADIDQNRRILTAILTAVPASAHEDPACVTTNSP